MFLTTRPASNSKHMSIRNRMLIVLVIVSVTAMVLAIAVVMLVIIKIKVVLTFVEQILYIGPKHVVFNPYLILTVPH